MNRIMLAVSACAGLACAAILPARGLPALLLVLPASYLARRSLSRRAKARALAEADRALPHFVEEILICLEAGMDIIPALAGYRNGKRAPDNELDCAVNEILRLSKAGLTFESSVRSASEAAASPSVRHTLLYLAQAHRSGGELIPPLRELADATQASRRDASEEELALLPVKATVPLLMIFAGLLLILLTPPFINLLGLANQGGGYEASR